MVEAAEALDIPPGPWRKDLVAGQAVVLPDGRRIHPDQVLGEMQPGTSLVVVGDVGRADKLLEYVHGADAMVIEATYLNDETEMAATFGHSTAEEVARLAQEAEVKQLILTHVSRRYRDEEILEEAQSIFPNSWVARDFDNFQIKRSE